MDEGGVEVLRSIICFSQRTIRAGCSNYSPRFHSNFQECSGLEHFRLNPTSTLKKLFSVEVGLEVVILPMPHAELGDADGDGQITINDVTTLINYILSDGSEGVNLDAADVDGDGIVTINDVTTLIDYILKGTWSVSLTGMRS